MIRTAGKMTMLALALFGFASAAGCNGRGGTNTPSMSQTQDATGSVSFALQLAGGGTLRSASYTITGPNNYSKTGAIDLSSSTTLSATIGGIPAANGYQINITATTTDGATSCAGSATFDVTARQTRSVNVPLTCHEAARTGSVLVNGTLNICPTIDGISANPAEVQVGGTIALTGSAHDTDAGPEPAGLRLERQRQRHDRQPDRAEPDASPATRRAPRPSA